MQKDSATKCIAIREKSGNFRSIGITSHCYIRTLLSTDDLLYVGGSFDSQEVFGVANSNNLVAWNGIEWLAVGPGGIVGKGYALEVFAEELHVGGAFSATEQIPTGSLIKLNKTGLWQQVLPYTLYGDVSALKKYQSSLFIAGSFLDFLGNSSMASLLRFDGSQAYALDEGKEIKGRVNVLEVNPVTNNLIIGGVFTSISGVSETVN